MPYLYPRRLQPTLLGLVEALREGLDPAVAYGLYQDFTTQMANNIAQRQSRMLNMAEMLMGIAGQGLPMEAAETVVDVMPGKPRPWMNQMVNQLYPGGGASDMSPLYQPPTIDPLKQIQMERAAVELAQNKMDLMTTTAWPEMIQWLLQARQQGVPITAEQAANAYPELYAEDPMKFVAIVAKLT